MSLTNSFCLDEIRSMALVDEPNRIENKADLPTVGVYLCDNYLEPNGYTAYRLSKATGMPRSRISEIIGGRRRVTAETALLLSECLGTDPMIWLMLQAHNDLMWADMCMSEKLKDVEPLIYSDGVQDNNLF